MGLFLLSLMVFFSCQYGVDYLPSVVLLNEDYRNYVRGFFLNNKYQYLDPTYCDFLYNNIATNKLFMVL